MNRQFPRNKAQFDGSVYILHGHTIARFEGYPRTCTLDSCGWRTLTTKNHMNDVLHHCGFPYTVCQENYEWLVYNYKTGERIPFEDGMILSK